MKKLFYFMIVAMFALTGCKKEEIIEPEPPKPIPIITIEELRGEWITIEWEIMWDDGDVEIYTECSDRLNGWGEIFGKTGILFKFLFEYYSSYHEICTLYNMCTENCNRYLGPVYYIMDEEKNQIIFHNDIIGKIYVIFQVLEYDKEAQVLKFMLSETVFDGMSFVNSIYTIAKQ